MCKAQNKSSGFGCHKGNVLRTLWVILTGLALTTGSVALGAAQSSSTSAVKEAEKRAIIKRAFKLQMPFIANEGQIGDERETRTLAKSSRQALKTIKSKISIKTTDT